MKSAVDHPPRDDLRCGDDTDRSPSGWRAPRVWWWPDYGARNRCWPTQQQHEILRPRMVERAVDDDTADVAEAQVLCGSAESQERVDLPSAKKSFGFSSASADPIDVLGRVEPHISRQAGEEEVSAEPTRLQADARALQLGDSVDALAREQLENNRNARLRAPSSFSPASIGTSSEATKFRPKSIPPRATPAAAARRPVSTSSRR